jgi:hypothetical protein
MQDILYHIHVFMPLRDAAQAACVSHAFLRSWRSYPKLMLDIYTIGLLETDYPSLDSISIDEIEDKINKGVVATIEEYYQKERSHGERIRR